METPAVLFDEKSLRRPEFQPGQAVVLRGGQAWNIPCPEVWLVPSFGPEGNIEVARASSFGPEFDLKLDAFQVAETINEEAAAMLGLAVDLLGRNYDLTPDHYRALLRYRVGDEDANRPLAEIGLIALGRGKVEAETQPVAA